MKNEKHYLSLPIDQCPDIEISDTKTIERKTKGYDGRTYTYKYVRRIYIYGAVNHDGILCVTIYNAAHEALFRTYIDDYDYISQYIENGNMRRSKAKLSHQFSAAAYCQNEFVTDTQSAQAAGQWLGSYEKDIENPYARIEKYMEDIGKRKIKLRNDKIRKSLDDIMLQIKPLPKDFEKWLLDVPFRECRYIIYKYQKRKRLQGYCTHCGQLVTVEGARHRKYGKCPSCSSKIMYIADSKLTDKHTRRNVCYIQKGNKTDSGNNEIIFRYFKADIRILRNGYTGDFTRDIQKRTYYCEEQRQFYYSGKQYKYADFRQTGEYRFCETWELWTADNVYIYGKNLKNVFEIPQAAHMKYIPWTKLCRNGAYSPYYLFTETVKYPIIESVIKTGMYQFVHDITYRYFNNNDRFDMEAKSILKCLHCTPADLKFFMDHNSGADEVEFYREISKLKKDDFEELYAMYKSNEYTARKLCRLARGRNIKKYREYFEAQLETYPNDYSWSTPQLDEVMNDYMDYIENAHFLGWNLDDTKVSFPEKLTERHDEAERIVRMMKNHEKLEKIHERYYENIFDFYYEDKQYIATLPRDAEDLKYEGDKLHHCVYTNYTERVAKGTSVIVTIRAKNAFYSPLTTAEIDPETYKVVQIRAEHNHTPEPEVLKFWDKYKEKVLKKLKERRSAA